MLTWVLRQGGMLGWAVTFPLRILPPLLDPLLTRLFRYRGFSITMVAYKPRYPAPHA